MKSILKDFHFVHDWTEDAKKCIQLMNDMVKSWKLRWGTNTWYYGFAYWVYQWRTKYDEDTLCHLSPQVTVRQALVILWPQFNL